LNIRSAAVTSLGWLDIERPGIVLREALTDRTDRICQPAQKAIEGD
jgi:hypothetical protein